MAETDMPILDLTNQNPTIDGRQSMRAMTVRNSVVRHFEEMGCAMLAELTLVTGRRVDLIGIDRKGDITIIEIKSSVEDFRVDQKWPEYHEFCDHFYFATLDDVPADIFPADEGFIIADQYGCEIIRQAERKALAAARRKAVSLRFARAAALKLERILQYANAASSGLPEELDRINGD